LTNGPDSSADNGVWRDANGGNAFLQLFAEAVAEDGVCGDERRGSANVHGEDDN
jgi:hypothetical protein